MQSPFDHSPQENRSENPELFRLLSTLARPESRRGGARQLARHLGADDLIVFILDSQSGEPVPATGWLDTLPDLQPCQQLLEESRRAGIAYGDLQSPDSASIVPATAIAQSDASGIVFLGSRLPAEDVASVSLLLPLLIMALTSERTTSLPHSEPETSRLPAGDNDDQSTTLESMRRELRQHREMIEANQREREFLSDASTQLSMTVDFGTVLEHIVQIAVPELADYAAIELVQRDGNLEPAAQEAINQQNGATSFRILSRDGMHSDGTTPAEHVAQSGHSRLVSDAEDSLILKRGDPNDSQSDPAEPSVRSAMFVPLVARDRVIGVLQLVDSSSRHRYDERDLALAEEFACRASLTLENARLFHQSQEAARAREEFLSIASHELKTPLTTVKGYIQILLRSLQDPEGQEDRIVRAVHHLDSQANRINALVSDLLDVSRIRQGRLQIRTEEIDLRETARRVIARFDDAPEMDLDHRLRLDAPKPISGKWDPFRLDQVLSNLISNALKYSTEGGEVTVTLRQNDAWATVTIQDEGMGISDRGQEHLFEPFYRDPQMKVRVGGTGLGLFITRQIVEGHGGQIEVESTQGVGSTFTVRLPRNLAWTDSR